MLRASVLILLLIVLVDSTGCQGDRELEQALLDYKNENTITLQLLMDQNEFLKDKVGKVEGRVEKLSEINRSLSWEFDAYARRPDEIKQDIIDEVKTRAASISDQQAEYLADLNGRLDRSSADFHQKLADEIDAMERTLAAKEEFFRFVFSEQDSINQVFAARFENRPWYESVLGRWEEREPSHSTP